MSPYTLSITIRRWSSVALAGFVVFVFIMLSMHLIHPEFNPKTRFLSEYALGEYGWLLNIAFLGNFIGSLALMAAIYHAYPPPFRSWTSLLCLGIVTISILTNFFPPDLYGNAITVSGYIHNIGAFVGSIAGLVFMGVFSMRLCLSGFLSGRYRLLLFPAIVAPILFLTMLLLVESMAGFVGITQRVYAALMLLWLIIISYGIRSGAIAPE